MNDRRYLGLTHNPFVGNQRGFFEAGERKACLDKLRHLSQWSRQVLVVSGPMGIGKTTIFRELSGNLEARVSAARLNGTLVSAGREVLLAVAVNFGISTPTDAFTDELIDVISEHVESRDKDGRFCVVLVDDAHLLDPSAIDSLLHLATISQLRIILFGDDALIDSVMRSTGGAAAQELRLAPLKKVEVRDYVEWRCGQAHYRGRSPLTDQQIEVITRSSGGLPGKINSLVNEQLAVLERGAGRGRRRFPDLHRGLITLIVLVTGLLYLIVQPEFGADEDASDAGSGEVFRAENDTSASDDLDDSEPLELLEELPVERRPQLEVADKGVADKGVADNEVADEEVVPTETSDPGVKPVIPAVKPVVAEVKPVPEQKAVEKKVAPKVAAAEPALSSGGARNSAWLLRQDPAKYTLQLVTLSSAASVKAFVDRQRTPSQFATYELKQPGRTLFVVVYGLYDTSEAADRAADNLPREIGRIKPWKRRMSAIHLSITGN
ncbi:MAG: AAA family ATPase [Proteobacteria bacterium]|nr:AAA family ATPase [Pseudomonadota bacterium]